MSNLKTTSLLESLHPNITEFISDAIYDEFVVGYRIPDSFFNFRCTWFILFETQFVIIDSVRPFRIMDGFSILDAKVEEVEKDGSNFIKICRSSSKDIFIPVDLDNPQSRRFSSILVEQVNSVVEEEQVDEDKLF